MNDWTSHTALVVEDSAVQRKHMSNLLRSLGFGTVLEAWNGADALDVLAAHGQPRIYLVLTDLDMPRMDGIELIRHLTERKLTEKLIVISARDPRLLEIVENMGSDNDHLHLLGTMLKPAQMDDLALLLERVGDVRLRRAQAPDRSPVELDDIAAALAQGQFLPYFQPKVAMDSGLVAGVEALARWNHPAHGVLGPYHFISAIEGTPLMAPMTLAMTEQALRQLMVWRGMGLSSLKLSLNLSADILCDHQFVDTLDELVASHGVPASAVIWEVTETTVMDKLSQSLANVARLQLKGYGLAMDDYGIGYSSMQQLSRCPFTELKIDRVFVDGASQRSNRRVILESAIDMGHRLGVTTVAEGVEKMSDWALLRELGCDLVQGFMIAKPMPGAAMAPWIKENRARLRTLAASGQPAAA
ncbi:MAG: EAL domain-containing response regulator [Pseudomonadota bacterium]